MITGLHEIIKHFQTMIYVQIDGAMASSSNPDFVAAFHMSLVYGHVSDYYH